MPSTVLTALRLSILHTLLCFCSLTYSVNMCWVPALYQNWMMHWSSDDQNQPPLCPPEAPRRDKTVMKRLWNGRGHPPWPGQEVKKNLERKWHLSKEQQVELRGRRVGRWAGRRGNRKCSGPEEKASTWKTFSGAASEKRTGVEWRNTTFVPTNAKRLIGPC